MALYMDLHRAPDGLQARELADAHAQDLQTQEKYGVKYLTYWFNEVAGQIFCLVDAPSVNAAVRVHREAHGLVADEIIEVEQSMVAGFLGNGQEMPTVPEAVDVPGPERDRATRTILFTDIEASVALTQRVGDEKAVEMLRAHDAIITGALEAHGGNPIKHTGDGMMVAFRSAANAVECAITIQADLATHRKGNPEATIRVRIGINAGEPVTDHGDLFGTCVQLAARICDKAEADQILVTGVVRDICVGTSVEFIEGDKIEVKGFDGQVPVFVVPWH